MFNKIPSLRKSISLLVIFLLFILLVSTTLFIALLLFCSIIVPITWLYGLVTDQSYDRVCDNSELLFQLNRIGKITLPIFVLLSLLIFFI